MSRLRAITGVVILLLSACAPAAAHAAAVGTVTGTLQMEGGPIAPDGRQPGKRPVPGTVQFTSARQQRVTVQVGSSGTFSVQLPPGTYAVCSRPSGAPGLCLQGRPVTVTARHTTEWAFTFAVP